MTATMIQMMVPIFFFMMLDRRFAHATGADTTAANARTVLTAPRLRLRSPHDPQRNTWERHALSSDPHRPLQQIDLGR